LTVYTKLKTVIDKLSAAGLQPSKDENGKIDNMARINGGEIIQKMTEGTQKLL